LSALHGRSLGVNDQTTKLRQLLHGKINPLSAGIPGTVLPLIPETNVNPLTSSVLIQNDAKKAIAGYLELSYLRCHYLTPFLSLIWHETRSG